jgi:hypothetical protein
MSDPLQDGANLERAAFRAKLHRMLRVGYKSAREALFELLRYADKREKRTRARKGGL